MIKEKNGRLFVQGPVVLENALQLCEEGGQYLSKSKLLFDFSEATEIDSAAVSLMLEWSRNARAQGREVEFFGLGPDIASLTDLYGVEDLIRIND